MATPRLIVRPLRKTDWTAIEALFGERGACGGCWCMAWRRPGREWEQHKGASNKRAFTRLVTGGEASGLLAFAGREPVGWCSLDPRADFKSLVTKRSLKTEWDEDTWSVTCFFIRREWRGKGVGGKLLKAAVDLARKKGARRLEGYPVVPYTAAMPGAFAWTGLPQMFERQRFRPLPDPPGKRPIYVRRFNKK
jgi:GNAT superfamily N-acetyltransferase